MGRYGSTDSVFYIEQDFWPHNTALFVTDFQGNEKRWCYYMLRTISKGDYAGKSAVPGVDRKDLYEIVVPVPPRTEQLQVAESLDSRLAELNRATEKTYHEIDLIREYRTRLISDVVTGQLDVREATGNLPAEVEQPSAAADDETEELLEAVADDE
jgi:type I restriction enzyme S subunit